MWNKKSNTVHFIEMGQPVKQEVHFIFQLHQHGQQRVCDVKNKGRINVHAGVVLLHLNHY